jgi:2-methylcitrate dehydratase PrpD
VPAGAAGIICEPWTLKQAPPTGHAARWSLPAVVAARLVEGTVGLETFERVPSPPVLALAARCGWEPLGHDRFPARFEAEIRVRLRDGQVQEVRVEDADGNRSRPAAPERVREKFRVNALRSLPPGEVARLEAAVDGIAADADGLGRLMQALGMGA